MNHKQTTFGLLHFLALYTLSVSQPIFDLLAKNVEFFLFRQSLLPEISLYAILLGLGVPLALYVLTFSLLKPSARLLVSKIWVTVYLILLSLLLTKTWVIDNGYVVIALAISMGVAGAFMYFRWTKLHQLLGYMSIIAVLAPALFLFSIYQALDSPAEGISQEAQVLRTDIPVFILVLDELSLGSLLNVADEIDAQRFPNFARFSDVSTWYKNASTVADSTPLAIPALVTGRRPVLSSDGNQVPATAASHPRNLFSLFSHTHNIFASESITLLCAERICGKKQIQSTPLKTKLYSAFVDSVVVYLHQVLPASFANSLPSISSNWGGFHTPARTIKMEGLFFSRKQVDRGFENIAKADSNDIHYIHINMPHHPWIHYPSGKRYRKSYLSSDLTPIGIEDWMHANGHLWGSEVDKLAVARQRQDMQIGYADTLLGEFLNAISESGLFDKSLIVVLADHGSNIASGEIFRWATDNNVANLMSIPLFVKYPQQKMPAENKLNAEIVDVFPTILDVLDVRHSWTLDGHSLRDLQNKNVKNKVILRTVPGTSTEKNKARGSFISLEDISIFDAVWRDPNLSKTKANIPLLAFDRSYDKSLLGASVASLNAKISDRIVEVERLDRFQDVKLSRNYLPGYLRMHFSKTSAEESFKVVIGLNGIIQNTRLVSSLGSGSIEAILPESAFVKGSNNLEVLIAHEKDKSPKYEKLRLKARAVHSATGHN